MISFPLHRPVTEATKPPQQLSTLNSSGDVNVTSLIAKLLAGYDKRLRPNFGGQEKPSLISNFSWSFVSCLESPVLIRHAFIFDTSFVWGLKQRLPTVDRTVCAFWNLPISSFLIYVNPVPLRVVIISMAFFYLSKIVFSDFLQFKAHFALGYNNNSKYRDWTPLTAIRRFFF